MNIVRIGLDLAKNVFELYGIDIHETPALLKTIKRADMLKFFCQLEPCIIGMESCDGAHYWARELKKLGHQIRIMAPQFVSPYRKGSKNDHNDSQAICKQQVVRI